MKKKTVMALAVFTAICTLSLAASASAMPFFRWNNFSHFSDRFNSFAPQQNFVRVDGSVKQVGQTNVTGTIEAQSRTVFLNATNYREGSSLTALWTTNTSQLGFFGDRANYTYTFYSASLSNASISSINTTGYSLFMNGTWNVYKVTMNYTITTDSNGNVVGFNRNQNALALATNAYGEFMVASSGSNFTLAINGVDPLTGSVHVQSITTRMFNPFQINSDYNSTQVSPNDLASVVKAYGSSPGWGQYNQRMDYNFNYRIDITDLTTAAANVNA